MVDHHLDGLVGGQEAMLDAVDTGPDAGPDGGIADGVRRHPDPGAVRLVGDRGELRIRVLLGTRRGAVRHHPTGGRHLDQLCAVADLIAHAGDDVGDAVGDSLGDRQGHDARCQTLEHRRIEVPPIGSDGVAGRVDPRAGMPTLVDGALQCDIEEVAAGLYHQAEVAHRGETGIKGGAGVHRAAQGAVGRVVLHTVHRCR